MTFYLGSPGNFTALNHPMRGISATLTRPVTVTGLLSGARAVQRGPDARRTYSLAWRALSADDFSILEEFYAGARGPGPFILIDPGRSNLLTLNQSSATTAGPANSTDGFSVAGIGEALSSATTPVYRAGARSLAWALPGVVTGGVLVFAAPANLTQIPVLASTAYAAQIRVRLASATPAVAVTLSLVWLDSAGATLSTSSSSSTAASSGAWTQVTVTASSPSNAVYVRVQVTATVTASASDAFGRTSASGWGTADVGGTWTDNGGVAGDFTVGSGVGSQSMTAVASPRRSTLGSVSVADLEAAATVTVPVVATGNAISAEILVRYQDSSNYIQYQIRFGLSGAVVLRINKIVAGVTTTLATGTPANAATYTAASSWKFKGYAVGTTLKVKMWASASTEPSTWDLTVTDSDLTAAGAVGLRSQLITGNTNTLPVALAYDNFSAGAASTVYIDTPGLHLSSTVPDWSLGTGIPQVVVTEMADTYRILPRHDGAWTLTEVG